MCAGTTGGEDLSVPEYGLLVADAQDPEAEGEGEEGDAAEEAARQRVAHMTEGERRALRRRAAAALMAEREANEALRDEVETLRAFLRGEVAGPRSTPQGRAARGGRSPRNRGRRSSGHSTGSAGSGKPPARGSGTGARGPPSRRVGSGRRPSPLAAAEQSGSGMSVEELRELLSGGAGGRRARSGSGQGGGGAGVQPSPPTSRSSGRRAPSARECAVLARAFGTAYEGGAQSPRASSAGGAVASPGSTISTPRSRSSDRGGAEAVLAEARALWSGPPAVTPLTSTGRFTDGSDLDDRGDGGDVAAEERLRLTLEYLERAPTSPAGRSSAQAAESATAAPSAAASPLRC